MAVIEVETVESVNNLEALAEWVPFGRLKPEFHLYVPAAMVDVARRMCTDSNIPVAEIHSYHWIGDEMRFLPVYKAPSDGRAAAAKPAPKAAPPKRAAAKSMKKKPAKAGGAEARQENLETGQTQIALPTLRFTRDKRGYETTFLVHAVRRDGRSRERILYWFRTPPGVRVGRPALDEEAIRWIEDQNPDIEFDWPKILEAKAPPSAAARRHAGPPRPARQERTEAAACRAKTRSTAPRTGDQPESTSEPEIAEPEPAGTRASGTGTPRGTGTLGTRRLFERRGSGRSVRAIDPSRCRGDGRTAGKPSRADVRPGAADTPARAVCRNCKRGSPSAEAIPIASWRSAPRQNSSIPMCGSPKRRFGKASNRSSRRSASCVRRSGCAAGADRAGEGVAGRLPGQMRRRRRNPKSG